MLGLSLEAGGSRKEGSYTVEGQHHAGLGFRVHDVGFRI